MRESSELMAFMPLERVNILGVGVHAVNMPLSLAQIEAWIATRQRHYVCVSGVHGIMESQADITLRRIHNQAGLVVPDGVPLVWLSRLAGRSQVGRVYGPDLMLALCQVSVSRGYRHYLYGGLPGVNELLGKRLQDHFPGIQIAGMNSPPMRSVGARESDAVLEQINQSAADIVWVGLSTPKQEYWMWLHRQKLAAPVLIGVGAAFDFHAGIKRQAPQWMRQNGLEWLFRLGQEPRRLWRRYLINNPRFLSLVCLQACGLRKFPLDSPEGTSKH